MEHLTIYMWRRLNHNLLWDALIEAIQYAQNIGAAENDDNQQEEEEELSDYGAESDSDTDSD